MLVANDDRNLNDSKQQHRDERQRKRKLDGRLPTIRSVLVASIPVDRAGRIDAGLICARRDAGPAWGRR